MFSKGVHVTNTDSHSIMSVESGKRTNTAKDIEIQNHVQLGYNVNINKDVIIKENSVVAGHSVVTKSVPSNYIVVGLPIKMKKTDGVGQESKYYHLINKLMSINKRIKFLLTMVAWNRGSDEIIVQQPIQR